MITQGQVKVGATVAYYGGMSLEHSLGRRELLLAGIPVFQVHGCPYPEFALAEQVREGWAGKVDCLAILESGRLPKPDELRRVAELAVRTSTVSCNNEMMVIPSEVLNAVWEREARRYTNSVHEGLTLEDPAKPLFSPFDEHHEALLEGVWLNPKAAFLRRVEDAGFGVLREPANTRFPRIHVTVGSKSKRQEYNINVDYPVCLPTFGALSHEQQALVWELIKAGVTVVELENCFEIDVARSILVETCKSIGADGVFFLDHDISFQPKDVAALSAEAHTRQELVSGIYCMRKHQHALIGALNVPLGSRVKCFKYGDVYPAIYTGLGFTAIPMGVFNKLDSLAPMKRLSRIDWGPALRPYFSLQVVNNWYCGEDVAFCYRVKETGGELFIDTRVRLAHMGLYHYTLEDHCYSVPLAEDLEMEHVGSREELKAFFRNAAELTECQIASVDHHPTLPATQ